MIAHQCFVDSNIIIYANDHRAGEKHAAAKKELRLLWEQDPWPSLSIQVLQECYVNFLRKGIPEKEAHQAIENFMQWNVVDNDKAILRQALRLKTKFNISLWDASIIAAAHKAKAKYLLSEDLAHQFSYENVTVINPFIK